MQERVSRRYYNVHKLSEGVPLVVRALEIRNPEIKEQRTALQREGVILDFQQLKRTPHSVREVLHPEDRAIELLDEATKKKSKDVIDTAVTTVKNIIDSSLIFTSPGATEDQQVAIDRLNNHFVLRLRRERLARRRLLSDRPKKELKSLAVTGAVTIGAGVLATVLEAKGLTGWGLLVAQSVDDIATTVATAKTEKGGSKSFKLIAKENWPILPILSAAALADNTIIPHLLESPSIPLRIAGGALFSLAAIGGSVSANSLSVLRNLREERKNHKEITRIEVLSEAWKQNTSHLFRKYLWIGSGLSVLVSSAAAAKGVLIGQPYSAALQTILGQLETITAYSGLLLANTATNIVENVRDRWTVMKAKKSNN